MDRAVETIVQEGSGSARDVLKPHLRNDADKNAEFCVNVLKKLNARLSRKTANKFIAAVAQALSSRVLARVVDRVLLEKTFGHGRMHAVARLGYFPVPSAILLDYFCVDLTEMQAMATLAKSYPKEEVREIVKLVLANHDKPEVVFEQMQKHSFFASSELVPFKEAYSPKKVHRFAEIVCKEAGIEMPSEVRFVNLALFIEPTIEKYKSGRMEARDFFIAFRDFTRGDRNLEELALAVVQAQSPDLAGFLMDQAKRTFSSSSSSSDESSPKCDLPYNESLHKMCSDKDFVIAKNNMSEFERCLESCSYFCLDFYPTKKSSVDRGPMGLLTFRFRTTCAFLMPNLFPEMIPPVVAILRRYPRPALTFKWDKFGKMTESVLGWKPEVVHDAGSVSHGQEYPTLSLVARSVTKGEFCARAGIFNDTAIPSTIALRHRAMRAAVIYEYVVEGLNLRRSVDERVDPRERYGHSSRDFRDQKRGRYE